MASEITYKGQDIRKGRPGGKMTKGTGWRLVAVKGQKRYFVGTLLYTYNSGAKRLALFSVPK
jgi:hypothetical protein